MTPEKVNNRSIIGHIKNLLFESDCPLCFCETNQSSKTASCRNEKTATLSSIAELNQSLICDHCASLLPFLVESCEVCAMPISSSQQVCGQCLQKSPEFNKTVAAFHYEPPISDFIQNIKYL